VRRRFDVLVVFVVALAARLAIVAWAHARFGAVEDGHYYDVLARRVAAGAGYTWLWPDGAVTFAAHYPVGYPAMLALAYAAFGASAGVAMGVNALVGAAAAPAAYALVDAAGGKRWRPLAAGLVVALHPALVPYTAAVMTEGVTAALLVVVAALADRASRSPRARRWLVAAGLVMGIATLVRPQSLLLAPVLGALAVRGRTARLGWAAGMTAIALACCLPWTARNCARMHRCALVSVNGGWNLLIGAQTENGAWEPMRVPEECATVWDEARKDGCFERAAWRTIRASPGAWFARAPAKLAATFDYFGAAPWYLHASDAADFGDDAKLRLGVVETVACRLLLLGALFAVGWMRGPREVARKVVASVGAAATVMPPWWLGHLPVLFAPLHGWLGYVAVAACAALLGPRAVARSPLVLGWGAAAIAATALVHSVFFGAGRYGLVVAPIVAAIAFLPTRAVPPPDP
jgi:4-amino-4-deoxy-L-arabinose transferase-like glycosyltransferase